MVGILGAEDGMVAADVEARSACPHCGSASVRKNGSSRGHARWHCRSCGKSYGAKHGTPLYRLHTPVEEIARTLLIVMRRGSLQAAEELSGHKYETGSGERGGVGEVEVDAFWSFVGNGSRALKTGQVKQRGWAKQWTQGHAGGA